MPLRNVVIRRALSTLGLLQLAALVFLAGDIFWSLLLIWFTTDEYFTPLNEYFSSVKIAVPPVVIFLTSYLLAFLMGISISDAPKAVLAFLRNKFFQSVSWMVIASALSLIFASFVCWRMVYTVPPAYDQFVAVLLGGSTDKSQLVKERIESIRKVNPKLAEKFIKVVEVFSHRYDANAADKIPSAEWTKIYIRALDSNIDEDWLSHPLRIHALAEAYLLLGQGIEVAIAKTGQDGGVIAIEQYQKAIELYGKVLNSDSRFSTPLLKASAQNNIGNAWYYAGKYEKALEAWRGANIGTVNLSSWGNIVAALILLKRWPEAIEEGSKAKNWAEASGRVFLESYQYAGVLGNTGFAKLQMGDFSGALSDFKIAQAVQDDTLSRQNLALAFILNGNRPAARQILRTINAPIVLEALEKAVKNSDDSRCTYFIWGLAIEDSESSRITNYLAFLGEARTGAEINGMSEENKEQLFERVRNFLKVIGYPCRSLSEIIPIVNLVHR